MTSHSYTRPLFDLNTPQDNHLLHQQKILVKFLGQEKEIDADFILDLRKINCIKIEGYITGLELPDIQRGAACPDTIELVSINGQKFDGLMSPAEFIGDQTLRFTWQPQSEPMMLVLDKKQQLHEIYFHLFDFPPFISERSTLSEDGSQRLCCLEFEYNGWIVKISEIPETRSNKKLSADFARSLLSHTGHISMKDGSIFSAEQGKTLLLGIRFFLTFLTGQWCNPSAACGFTGSSISAHYFMAPRNNLHKCHHWLPLHYAKDVEQLFPMFIEKWESPDWHPTIRESLYWYQNANDSFRGIDAGIILTHAALERIAHHILPKHIDRYSNRELKDQKRYSASRLKCLFEILNLPTDITNLPTPLLQLAQENDWKDAPRLFTEIRNSLIHPERILGDRLGDICSAAWGVGLTYLELCLLAIFNYPGRYCNRITAKCLSDAETVPWL